jgi:ketosteroid isomerase-like protein
LLQPCSEPNTQIVLSYIRLMNSRDPAQMAEAVALMAEDATYWMPGEWANGGTWGRDEVAAMVMAGTDVFATPLELTIHGITASGDRVAVEMSSQARFKDGRLYSNTYHSLFIVQGGRITAVKEYMDTLYAYRAYFEPA